MKIKKVAVTTLLAALVLTLSPSDALAQFKGSKYKSKTKYNTSGKSAANLLKKKKGSSDFFGRSSSTNAAISASKDKKYVNLNPETAFGPEVITSFDFPSTSLTDLTKHMQKLTGINLILDKDLKGKVSIMAPTAITVGDAWRAYLTALNLNGYTLVKSGSFYKIVNARDIRYTPTKIYTGNYTPNTDNYVMKILPLKNINSTEVTRSFRPFMSRYGRIIDIKQTNTIIVQDTGSNINRLTRLIKFIDVPGHEESLQIMPVKNSSAQEIAKLLDKIFKGTKSSKVRSKSKSSSLISNIKLIAEPRTNSIIAMTNAEGAKQLSALIRKLDVKLVNSSSGQIHVYYLNHGTSETLAKTLSTLVSSSKPASKSKSRFSKSLSSNDSGSLFNAAVKITSDKENNAIVVTASPTDYLTIKEVIRKLDRPRSQVFVEGMIMETSVTKDRGFGINIIGAYGNGATDKAGFIGNGGDLVNVMTNNITSLGGLFVGGGAGKSVTQTIGGTEVQIKSISALITAVAANASTNVLATPQIMCLDNEEAIFEVGESVPTPEKTDAANGSSSTSVKQQKVALTLKITPQINKVTRFIKLKIDQKIDDFSSRSLPSGVESVGVATTTRSAITSVVVRDRDTVAMGGLMRDKQTDVVSKVPLLGDIPVLGWLFKNTITSVEKINLLFFLTPKIIDVQSTANAKNLQDQLNRRSTHLKDALGEDDPFATTAKGLYDKAKRQEKGPLYNEEEASKYRKENEAPGIGDEKEEDLNDPLLGFKNMEKQKVFVQKIKSKASATKK
ncbi:type II secretion system protein GspD [Halobacteriovorax marinus]|uniref:Type II secretion system protein GspD n=1 Tax=Halobacteriovorax marinus TaxID=97084 RepID=A0A1Y5FDQ8_9BACT|nr:type II secretion system protein GspD [Halobacteriovorax marinus]